MTVTLREAASLVCVSRRTVEDWVRKGYLTACNPDRPRGRPARYLEDDVVACADARRPMTWHARVGTLADEWRQIVSRRTSV